MHQSILKKYTVKTFNDIIGQKYTVSFLKNSLYKNVFYPLYLFAGMRGTGKTSSARVFALAALCENLQIYQKNSSFLLPCYDCQSCKAYLSKNHPDIIELDAASHTGIDTIRAIIDNAYVLPILSKKKFYIIDEVHMLSKGAFNACLKIMEEPPQNVHFILATTEIQKVIETIRSRSIILNFKPISVDILKNYVLNIVQEEKIIIDDKTIDYIMQLAEYSVRDTCNIIERLQIISKNITSEMVFEEYGYPQKELIIDITKALLKKETKSYFLKKKDINITHYGQKIFFELIVKYLQELIQNFYLLDDRSYSIELLFDFLSKLYMYENSFLTSHDALGILDLFLTDSFDKKNNDTLEKFRESIIHKNQENKEINNNLENTNENISEVNNKIDNFINQLDSALQSIFKQGEIIINEELNEIEIQFKKNFSFYRDFLETKKEFIDAKIKEIFLKKYTLKYIFKDNTDKKKALKDSIAIIKAETQSEKIISLIEEKKNIDRKTMQTVKQNKNISHKEIEKKQPSAWYEKKIKKPLNPEDLPSELKKIVALFPGITYLKEDQI